jgi:Protein of unknown function (DUF4239)
MNIYWIYDLKTWVFCTLAIGVWVAFSLAGLYLTRGIVKKLWGEHAQNDLVSFYLAAIAVFYGVSLGLIAVGAWENYTEVDNKVAQEASSLAAMWRDANSYPEPARQTMRTLLKDYTRATIDSAWPAQERGRVPASGLPQLHQLETTLAAFEPKTAGQTAMHGETLREFNQLMFLRQMRIESVSQALPLSVWLVAVLGGIINIMVTWLFLIPKMRVHVALTTLFAALTGLLIFLMAAVDNPYRGSVSVSADAFELVYGELMK